MADLTKNTDITELTANSFNRANQAVNKATPQHLSFIIMTEEQYNLSDRHRALYNK